VDTEERALFPETYDEQGGNGILPWQQIKRMVATGHVSASPDVLESQIQPASIDLRLGSEAYRVQASFLPGHSTTLLTKVHELLDSTIDLTQATPALLEPGVVYIIPLLERLRLPGDVQGVANPKSTTGRLDIFTRLITEHGDQFDRVPKGYRGLLYAEVSPRTFPVRVRPGMTLNQLRFVRGAAPNALDPIRNGELRELAEREPLVYDAAGLPTTHRVGDGIQLTVDLEGERATSIVAYRAKEHPRAIELDRLGYYDVDEYWEAIPRPRSGHIILAKGGFYLLASKAKVSVPLTHAAEMVAHDPSMGEFRVHYAGFFDPGFGYGAKKGEICGTKAVLEVRAYEVPILLEDDDVVGRLHYYPMAASADRAYGSAIGSSYQQQGLALSKQFKRADRRHDSTLSASRALATA
jgi:dCTP deaminase